MFKKSKNIMHFSRWPYISQAINCVGTSWLRERSPTSVFLIICIIFRDVSLFICGALKGHMYPNRLNTYITVSGAKNAKKALLSQQPDIGNRHCWITQPISNLVLDGLNNILNIEIYEVQTILIPKLRFILQGNSDKMIF